MDPAAQKKIKEYKRKYLAKAEYVLEIGSFDTDGGNRHLFEDVDDFCGIDNHRGPGVDIVTDCSEVDRLLDYNPDVVICLDVIDREKNKKKIVRAVRETVMPGGLLIISIPSRGEGSYADALFEGYDVFDLTIVGTTICGIAQKPYKIGYDT